MRRFLSAIFVLSTAIVSNWRMSVNVLAGTVRLPLLRGRRLDGGEKRKDMG